ncbi:MAG: hypothetical protein IKE69_08035 [Thermoguttaceae bacterium]|nr:hypothetical protein [Thermoguttaceae bacterium]
MAQELVTRNEGALAPGMFDSLEQMTAALTVAEKVSQSNILPDTFKGKAGDVLIALDMAQRLRMNPLHVMQGIVIVHGRPTFSGQFYASLIKASGEFVKYDYEEKETGETVKEIAGRKNRACRIVAVRPNGEKVAGPWVDYQMAVKDGWATRSGSKWQTMPELMLRYRAASFFVRTCCPDAAMGLRDEYEQDDIARAVSVHAERPRAIVETEVFKETVEAEVIEPEDEGISSSDAAEVMNQTIEDAPKPSAKESTADEWTADDLYTWYAEKIVNAKTKTELEAQGKAIKGLQLPKESLDNLRALYVKRQKELK